MTFTVCHGKIHHVIKFGKPSVSMAIYTMVMLSNERVPSFMDLYGFVTPGATILDFFINIGVEE